MLKYDSIAELVNEAEKRGLKLSELVLKTQAAMTEKTEEEMFATMERSLQVMKESVQDGLDKDKRSASGLTGGDAYKLNEALKAGKNIAGHFFGNAMMKAVAVAQTNACMGRIVASPTAGSCGILPSALLTLQEEKNISDKDLVMALFTASAVGIVIATNASVAGAELALAGVESHIPADEVIVAMKKIGDTMSSTLKETAEGGLAVTPTGKKLCEKVFG